MPAVHGGAFFLTAVISKIKLAELHEQTVRKKVLVMCRRLPELKVAELLVINVNGKKRPINKIKKRIINVA